LGSEVELKLDVTPARARKFSRSQWLKKISCAPPERQRLVSVYYDTKDLKLRKHDVMLRVRRIGERRIQTVEGRSKRRRRRTW
jgi:inorganic triphosphatase YgiF